MILNSVLSVCDLLVAVEILIFHVTRLELKGAFLIQSL